MDRHTGLLPRIDQELTRFARKGFAYTNSNLRQRHIRLQNDNDGKEQIFLVDLESMEKREVNVLDQVRSDVERLKSRAHESVQTLQELIHPWFIQKMPSHVGIYIYIYTHSII